MVNFCMPSELASTLISASYFINIFSNISIYLMELCIRISQKKVQIILIICRWSVWHKNIEKFLVSHQKFSLLLAMGNVLLATVLSSMPVREYFP